MKEAEEAYSLAQKARDEREKKKDREEEDFKRNWNFNEENNIFRLID